MRVAKTSRFTLLAFLPAAMLTLALCSATRSAADVSAIETADGAVIVDTTTVSAKVTAIDAAKRKLTLALPDGSTTKYKAGAEVVNFAQIKVGDTVKATVTEQVAIFIGSGAPPSAASVGGVALAPVGAKPAGVLVDVEQMTAKVTAVDAEKHKVTFQFADGSSKKVKVNKKLDLSKVHVGDNVTVQVSEGLALSVEKS